MAAGLYGVACLAVCAWAARTLASRWSVSGLLSLFVPLVAYTAGLALAARRMHAAPSGRRAFPWLVAGVALHALFGAAASVVLAALPYGHGPLTEVAGSTCFWLVLLGWVPPLLLRLSGHGAGAVLLVSTLGAAWLLWLTTSWV